MSRRLPFSFDDECGDELIHICPTGSTGPSDVIPAGFPEETCPDPEFEDSLRYFPKPPSVPANEPVIPPSQYTGRVPVDSIGRHSGQWGVRPHGGWENACDEATCVDVIAAIEEAPTWSLGVGSIVYRHPLTDEEVVLEWTDGPVELGPVTATEQYVIVKYQIEKLTPLELLFGWHDEGYVNKIELVTTVPDPVPAAPGSGRGPSLVQVLARVKMVDDCIEILQEQFGPIEVEFVPDTRTYWGRVKSGSDLAYVTDVYDTRKNAENTNADGLLEEEAAVTIPEVMFLSEKDVPAGSVFPIVYDQPMGGTGAAGEPEWSVVGSPHVIADTHGQIIYAINSSRGYLWQPLDPPSGMVTPYLGYDGAPAWKELPKPNTPVNVLTRCQNDSNVYSFYTRQIIVQSAGAEGLSCSFELPDVPTCPPYAGNYVLTCSNGMMSWTELAEFECPEE